MSNAPLIGLTTSVTVGTSPERAYVNASYVNAIQQAGGIPVLLTPHLSLDARIRLWEHLSALVLSGGGDVDPARFGEARHPSLIDVSGARDDLEIDLTRRAIEHGVPLLAICRGIQVLNAALGGTLYQDIPSDPGSPIAHSQTEPRAQSTHAVKVQEGTRLAAILGRLEVDVNSFHHQAIKRPGHGLRVVAAAPDGIVEGVELAGHPFVVGVQWHPEELTGHDPSARNLFAAVVEAAAR
jgi:putative glutamine amidotransferase